MFRIIPPLNATLICTFALGSALFAAGAMHAARPERKAASLAASVEVKGEWIDCNTVTDSKEEGEHQVITVAIAEKFSGTLSGTYEGTERNVLRKDGSGSFKGSGVFRGEVNGRAGTAVMTYSGTIDKEGQAVARWVLDQGTDDLARIDGDGTFEGKQIEQRPEGCTDPKTQSAFAGTYSGKVQFLAR